MKNARGFTLLELLIGLTLVGFILALLFAAFNLASNSWDAAERSIEQTTDAQMGRAIVRRILAQAQPLRWKRGVNQPLTFIGDRDRLVTLAPLSGQAGASGLRVIELTAEASGASGRANRRLVLRQAPIRYDAEQFIDALAEAKEHTILDKLVAVEFSYFGPEKRGAIPHWLDYWDNIEQAPQLVRVKLVSADSGWSDILVAPMINGTDCNWDLFFKRCR